LPYLRYGKFGLEKALIGKVRKNLDGNFVTDVPELEIEY
jgi:hypothetical protein